MTDVAIAIWYAELSQKFPEPESPLESPDLDQFCAWIRQQKVHRWTVRNAATQYAADLPDLEQGYPSIPFPDLDLEDWNIPGSEGYRAIISTLKAKVLEALPNAFPEVDVP